MVGKTYRVLVEAKGSMKGKLKWKGRTSCFRIVHFEPESFEQDLMWNWVDLKISSASALSCQGEIVRVLGKDIS